MPRLEWVLRKFLVAELYGLYLYAFMLAGWPQARPGFARPGLRPGYYIRIILAIILNLTEMK